MPNPSFNKIWSRIIAHSGKTFYTKTGLEFTYEIKGKIFFPNRTTYQISIVDFEKAYKKFPIRGPGVINNIVRGPAYVWGVLHDSRIVARDTNK